MRSLSFPIPIPIPNPCRSTLTPIVVHSSFFRPTILKNSKKLVLKAIPQKPHIVTEEAVPKGHKKASQQHEPVSPFSATSPQGTVSASPGLDLTLTAQNVEMVLDEVRPYLIADGGDVEVVSVEDGVVSLRLQGACGACPSSTTTMKMGIEKVLREKFGDSLQEIVQVDQKLMHATVESVNSHLDMLRGAIHSYGGSVEVISVQGENCHVKYDGPAPIGMGIQAAIKDKFPDIANVILEIP
eukprot:TRINITY_DN29968_c0_g1_i1.p1 TRINITY_DN29968_c0_g1~~TRINITY_DN29968_c0_g1_i1.p1  ORF type:complete len:241 (+),score=57.29 TRINITY_DN29968_c0_g1_i1:181-903(+)